MRTTYLPKIESAETLEEFPLGRARALILSNIKSPGITQYEYILVVFEDVPDQPCFVITSEVNRFPTPGDGSHFLCMFIGDTHGNYGSSNDWADLETFKARALMLARAQLEPGSRGTDEPA